MVCVYIKRIGKSVDHNGVVVKRLLLSLLFFLMSPAAYGQGCGPTNPNCVVTTQPPGTNNNTAASTAFVQQAIGGIGGSPVTSVSNADGSLTIAPISGAVVASLNPAHANTWTATQTYNAGDQSLVGTRSGKDFSTDSPPANALRWKDKVFIGDAAANFGNSGINGNSPPPYPIVGGSCPSPDWFTTFYGTTQEGSCAYTYGFQLVVENDASSSHMQGGILGAVQNKNTLTGFGAIGIAGFGINNNPNSFVPGCSPITNCYFPVWAAYFECDYVVNNGTGCVGIEMDVGNTVSDGAAGTPDPFQQSAIVGFQDACGSGFGSHPTVFQCGSAMQIVNNGQALTSGAWKNGINFQMTSIVSQTLFGGGVFPAIVMPPLYALVWYGCLGGVISGSSCSVASTPVGGIEYDSAGNMQLGFNGASSTIVINGTGGSASGAGANCTPGTGSQLAVTAVVIKGIIIQCN